MFDFWIADTIGNFTGAIAIVFFDLAGVNPKYQQDGVFLIIITLGLIVCELLQCLSPMNILDGRDIIATLIAGLISWGIYELVCSRLKERNVTTPNDGLTLMLAQEIQSVRVNWHVGNRSNAKKYLQPR